MANKIFTNSQTPIYFMSSTGVVDNSLASGLRATASWDGLFNGSGWASSRYDLGPAPRCSIYNFRAYTNLDNSNLSTAGSTVDMFLATSDSTDTTFADGGIGSGDLPMTSTERRRNLLPLGSIQIDLANNRGLNQNKYITSGQTYIYSRYFSVVWWNATGSALGSGNFLSLTPVPDEIQ